MNRYKARIAIFSDSFLPQINGVVTSILNLATSLADRGYYILIVAPAHKSLNDFNYPNIEIKQISGFDATFYDGFKFTNLVSLSTLKLVKKRHIDLIHFETPITVSYIGIKIAKKLKLPLVSTFHTFFADPAYLQHWIIGTGEASQKVTWAYSNLFYNSADLVTTPSPSTALELKENGCTQEIKYISNGIDPKIFNNDKSDEIKKKYKLKDKTVMFTGRISQEKNLGVLVKAFIRSAEMNPDTSFLLVGDGPSLNDLKERVAGYNLSDRIIFTGSIPHEELVKSGILGACRLFVTASLTENQPMTILEAQCNGVVCIGPDARGIPYLIKNGENGIIVPPNDIEGTSDAINKLLTDDDLYGKMKEATLEEIKSHYIENIADTWEETYDKLIYHFHLGKIKFKKGFNFILAVIPLFIGIIFYTIGEKVVNLFRKNRRKAKNK